MTSAAAPPAARWALAAVAAAGSVVHLNTLPAALVWDDVELFAQQPLAREPAKWIQIFASPWWGPGDYLYRPFTLCSLALGHALGLPGQHLVNVVLHAAVACALYLLLRRLEAGSGSSLATALLFAVHPLHSEAVAQLVGRAELLAALLGLLFLLLHLKDRHPVAAAACLLGALCSKESAIAFLGLAAWTDACFRRGPPRFRPLAYSAYGAAAAVWLALRAGAVGFSAPRIPFLDNPVAHAAAWTRVLTAARVQFDYLVLQLVPVGLSADYSYAQVPVAASPRDWRVAGFAVTVAIAAVAVWGLRRREPVIAWGVAGYAILFLPTANLLFATGTIMGERLAYAPSLLAAAVAGHALWLLRRRVGPALVVALGLLLALCAGLTVVRNRTWSEPAVFARTLIRTAPASAKAHYTYAIERHDAGEDETALAELRRALEIYPGYAEAWSRLGAIQGLRGEDDAAADSYLRATRIHPEFTEAWYGLGHALHRLGRLEPAAEAYRTAIRLDAGLVSAYVNLGAIYAERGQLDEAERMWREALGRDPGHEAARMNLERLRELRDH